MVDPVSPRRRPTARPARAVQENFGFACGLSAVPAMATAHRHDDVEVLVTDGGSAILEIGGRRFELADTACAAFWAGIPHRLTDTGPEARVRWLTIPLIDVLGWGLPGAFTGELLQGMVNVFPAPPLLHRQMSVWFHEIGTGGILTEAARHEARALLLRVSISQRPADGQAVPTATPDPDAGSGPLGTERRAAAIAVYISTHFHEPLRLADIAAAVHVHPSRASALFRRHTGVSIGRYLAQSRIAEAQRLLISTDATTTDIAARAGFGSASSFYATFRAQCGRPPDSYRRQMRGGGTGVDPAAAESTT